MCSESDSTAYESDAAQAPEQPSEKKFVIRPDPSDLQWVQENLGDKYEVLALIGQGGMGCVYKVFDKTLQQTFAVKILYADLVAERNTCLRFEQEARAAGSLTHANLAAVYGFGLGTHGSPFIVMDFLDGRSLAEIIKSEKGLDVPTALDIFVQVAEALTYAHMKGLLHRDIKPGNIIVVKADNDVNLVKVVDFGIAKVMLQADMTNPNLTKTGDVFGSPTYMSPEQCLGEELDTRSDVYSFGCVMYETLTGSPPFADSNMIKTVIRQVQEKPQPVSSHLHGYSIPPALEELIMCCLEKNPANRYKSMSEVLFDLESVRHAIPLRYKPQKEQRLPAAPAPAPARAQSGIFGMFAAVAMFCAGCIVTFSALVQMRPYSAGPMMWTKPVQQQQSIAKAPTRFWFNYDPKHWRVWTQIDQQTWIEDDQEGRINEFRIIGRSTEEGIGPALNDEQTGTIVRRYDQAIDVFIPDLGEGHWVYFRERPHGWQVLGEMQFSKPPKQPSVGPIGQ